MAYSRVYYPTDGVTKDFTFGFGYIDKSHVKVYLDGNLVTNWVWLTDSTIRFNTAPTSGVVQIRRSTSVSTRLVDYTSPSSLNEADLDRDSLQAFYLSQEAIDETESTISENVVNGQFDAKGKRISNTASPVDDADVATKGWVEESYTNSGVVAEEAATLATQKALDAAASALASASARDAAVVAKSGAEAARDGAVTAATNAAANVQSSLDAKVTAAQVAKTGAETARDQAVAAAGSFDGTAYLRKDDNLNSVSDKASARANLGVQPALGWTPVRQGGGAGQDESNVFLGGASGKLKAQLASTDLGIIWTDVDAGKSLATSGYQKLPSGLIIQWGKYTGATADASLTFPVAFPTDCYAVTATPTNTTRTAANNLVALSTASISTTGFNFLRRWSMSGIATDTTDFTWIAIGR